MQKKLNLQHILTDSLYYPACDVDCGVIKYCNEHYDELGINKFIYADYGTGETRLRNNLEYFFGYPLGYNLIESHSVSPSVLGFDLSLIPECDEFNKEHILRWRRKAFARYAVFEKVPQSEEYGPERFSLLYLCAEGLVVYENLYLANDIVPKAMAIIQPGTVCGGNWTDFNDPYAPFAKAVMRGKFLPDYFFYGGYGPFSHCDFMWPEYRCIDAIDNYYRNIYRNLEGRVTVWQHSL